MFSDPIADLLTRVRNALAAKHKTVEVPHSKLKESLSKILVDNKYIKAVEVVGKQPKKNLKITLKYSAGKPVIRNLIRLSKPGRRTYINSADLSKATKGRGIIVLSTPKGLMTAKDAKTKTLGGEMLCKIN